MRLLLCTLAGVQYGVSADAVVEIVRAVAVTPLPGAPPVVEGLIDVRGTVMPVFDLRARLGLPSRAVDPADHFVVVRTSTRTAALHVDRVSDLVEVDERETTAARTQVPSSAHVAGVAALANGMAFIHDVETFLSRAESESLDMALAVKATASVSASTL